jgi:hypothetical protein
MAFAFRPRFFGCSTRPRRLSSWTRNCFPPQGRPVRVVVRMRATFSSSSVRSESAQSFTTPGGESLSIVRRRLPVGKGVLGTVPAMLLCRMAWDSPGNGSKAELFKSAFPNGNLGTRTRMEIWEREHSITMTSRHETVFLPELYENVCGALSALWVGARSYSRGAAPGYGCGAPLALNLA